MRYGLTWVDGNRSSARFHYTPKQQVCQALTQIFAEDGGAAVSPLHSVPHAPPSLHHPFFFAVCLSCLELRAAGRVQNVDFFWFADRPVSRADSRLSSKICILYNSRYVLITKLLSSPILYHSRKEKSKPRSLIEQQTQQYAPRGRRRFHRFTLYRSPPPLLHRRHSLTFVCRCPRPRSAALGAWRRGAVRR